MYLAGVSTRRIEDVGETLWGAGVSAGTASNLNDKAFKAVEEWRCRPLACEYPYAYYADFATPFHVPLLHRSAVG